MEEDPTVIELTENDVLRRCTISPELHTLLFRPKFVERRPLDAVKAQEPIGVGDPIFIPARNAVGAEIYLFRYDVRRIGNNNLIRELCREWRRFVVDFALIEGTRIRFFWHEDQDYLLLISILPAQLIREDRILGFVILTKKRGLRKNRESAAESMACEQLLALAAGPVKSSGGGGRALQSQKQQRIEIGKQDDLFLVLYKMLKRSPEVSEICPVKDAEVPLMQFNLEGISVGSPYAKLEVVSEPDNFQSFLRCIKLWAKQRGLYGNLFGFLGGIHLVISSTLVCQMSPDACLSSLVMNFNWPWPTPTTFSLQDGIMLIVHDVTKKDKLGEWAEWVKSRFPSLILMLEDINISCDPYPKEYVYSGTSVVFYQCLNIDQCTDVNVDSLEKEFRNFSNSYRGKPVKILLSTVPASELPNIEQLSTRKVKEMKALLGGQAGVLN